LEQAARHRLIWQSMREERKLHASRPHVRMGEWLRGTPLWPATWPVRALRRVWRSWRGSPPKTPNKRRGGP
jgi:hypothetical protein